MARDGGEPQEGADRVVLVVEDIGTRRSKTAGVRGLFQGGDSGGASLQFRDMGDDPPHGPGPGGFPEHSGQVDHRETDPRAS